MKRILLLCLAFVFVASGFAFAQERTITGRVTSIDDGTPLPGVNVVLKGTTTGTATDSDGRYSLTVPSSGGSLIFSFIGLQTQEIAIGEQSVVDVGLSLDATQLSEIVVTGVATGTPTKKLSFVVGKVNEDLIQNVPAVNAASALQGKMAGVKITQGGGTPGGSPNIQLRGATSLFTSSAPLVIVDGVLTEGSLADINGEDIQSIEVVKGSAAASLYGSRAANGVVNIISKRGSNLKSGTTEVKFRTEVGQSFIEHVPLKTTATNRILDANGNPTGVIKTDQIFDTPFPVVYNHFDIIFKPQTFLTNYVSVSTNTGKTSLFTSFQNTDQQGIVELAKGTQRKNFRINIDHNISDKLKVSASNLYSNSTIDLNVTSGGGGARNPIYSLMFLDPNANILAPNEEDGSPYNWNPNILSLEPNPLYALANRESLRQSTRFLGNYKIAFNPIDWWTLDAEYSVDRINSVDRTYTPKGYLDVAALAQAALGSIDYSTVNRTAQTLAFTSTFVKRFGDFNTRARLQYFYEDNQGESFEAYGNNLTVGGIPSLENAADGLDVGSARDQIVANNFSFIGAFDYKDKIIFDGLIRRDGVSLFGANVRWQNFYRLSGAYRLTEDVTINGIEEFKVRASYGVSGLRPPFSAQYNVYSLANGNAGSVNTIGNPNLKPSFAKELEVGFDMDFLSRFSLQVTYAKSENTDQIIVVPLSAVTGGASQWQNAGNLETNSLEVTLGAAILKKGAFSWNANLVWDRTRQTVTQLGRAPFNLGPGNAYFLKEGETFGVLYGEKFATSLSEVANQVPEGANINDLFVLNSHGYVVRVNEIGTTLEKPVRITNDDGSVKTDAKIGDINPDFNLGLANTFNYKNFSLFVLFDWQQGGDVYNNVRQYIIRDGLGGETDGTRLPQERRKPSGYYQALYNVNSITSHFVEDGTYVKLREVAFTYRIPGSFFADRGMSVIKGIKFGVVGRNLFTLTKYTGFDPEVGASAGGIFYRGYDSFGYPNFQTLSGSIEFTF